MTSGPIRFRVLATVLGIALPYKAQACRNGVEPEDLKNMRADAIVLAKITSVQPTDSQWKRWSATAVKEADVWGSPPQKEFTFDDEGPGGCRPGQPDPNSFWVLYGYQQGSTLRIGSAWPFWFARASRNVRLNRLNQLLPLGIVREPTAEESNTLDAVERTMSRAIEGKEERRVVHVSSEVKDLSRYTRVYSRSSARLLSVEMFRSRTPRRLVSDIREQGPTAASCNCTLYHGVIDLDEADLRTWGRPSAAD